MVHKSKRPSEDALMLSRTLKNNKNRYYMRVHPLSVLWQVNYWWYWSDVQRIIGICLTPSTVEIYIAGEPVSSK